MEEKTHNNTAELLTHLGVTNASCCEEVQSKETCRPHPGTGQAQHQGGPKSSWRLGSSGNCPLCLYFPLPLAWRWGQSRDVPTDIFFLGQLFVDKEGGSSSELCTLALHLCAEGRPQALKIDSMLSVVLCSLYYFSTCIKWL